MDKKLANILWSARWGTANNKVEFANEKITEALVYIGAEKNVDNSVDDVDIGPADSASEFTQPEFVVVKGVRFKDRGHYKTPSGKFKGLVVHYTVSGRTAASAQGVVKFLASKGYGCMVMDEGGKIYIPEGFDPLTDTGAHAGVSGWNGTNGLNSYFAGMEICNWGHGSKVGPFRSSTARANIIAGTYQTYTHEQEASLKNFCLWAMSINPEFSIQNVCGHDEARAYVGKKGDKQDPGASLSCTMPELRDELIKKAIQLRL